ncbi:NAD-dependent epimerase/dehydratase family protein [Terricaulis sp.]|uniref:NAD-dependent epimerase/dehydratase family protein n=1 Tax=Terricaulis sp. TaxID=2768686 RepID=UPI0037832DE5
MQTIAVLGASGVYARWLMPRLTNAGYKVRALVRRPDAAGVARACGADIRVADIFDEASLVAGLEGCDVGINIATSLPGPSGRGSYDENDRIRRDGTPIWINACRKAGVTRIIQQSIAMLSASNSDAWSDEDTTFTGGDSVTGRAYDASIAMEDAVRASDLDWIILRGALFYGPGTGFDDDWFERARAGKLRLPDDGSAYVSLLHISDMAAATLAALKHWPSRQTLIIADDEPALWRDVLGYVADIANAPAPQPGGRASFPSFRVSNARAKAALSWSPFYTNYRMGLAR